MSLSFLPSKEGSVLLIAYTPSNPKSIDIVAGDAFALPTASEVLFRDLTLLEFPHLVFKDLQFFLNPGNVRSVQPDILFPVKPFQPAGWRR